MASALPGFGPSLTVGNFPPPQTARRSYPSSVTYGHHHHQVLHPVAASSLSINPPPPPAYSSSISNRVRGEQEEHRDEQEEKEETYESSAGHVRTSSGWDKYLRMSSQLMEGSKADGGPPRWFCILPSAPAGGPSGDCPVCLYLPGLVGVGCGLVLQMNGIGQIFNVWCLHIPLSDRTPFTELVQMVEETVRRESSRRATTPVYLVAESFGACLALAVASRNPHLLLILILANPATSFRRSLQAQALLPLSEMMALLSPQQINRGLPSGMAMNIMKQAFGELAVQNSASFSSYFSVVGDLLNAKTLNWKMKLLKSGAEYANSRLHAVKARTLILSSGRDTLLPSEEEAERLGGLLPNCEIRRFSNSGHLLFLENDFDMATVIKSTRFYQRGRTLDYVSDYLPPKPSEFNRVYEPHRWMEVACNPVMLSTVGDEGKIVRGVSGIPSEGPVLLVGYHMLLGMELIPLVSRVWMDRSILLRGVAHPLQFRKLKQGRMPDLSTYDAFRFMGAVPVSAANLFKLFGSKSHVLLYPGGMREALHRKGEEYKLIWPEQSEFVRMAARFGATIVPFGAVGEDDFGEVIYDYDDLMKIPYFKSAIQELTQEVEKLRDGVDGEVGNQDIHLPIIAPKLPGRLYFLFGKPIETKGRKEELRSREAAQELYEQVRKEVEKNIEYLKHKREKDPYRSLVARLGYQAIHGLHSQVPTFPLSS